MSNTQRRRPLETDRRDGRLKSDQEMERELIVKRKKKKKKEREREGMRNRREKRVRDGGYMHGEAASREWRLMER